MLVQFLSKCASGGSPLAEQLQGQLCQANSPHTVVQPARPQTTLGNLKSPSFSLETPWEETRDITGSVIVNYGITGGKLHLWPSDLNKEMIMYNVVLCLYGYNVLLQMT